MSLIPPNVDDYDALKLLREDVKALQNGFTIFHQEKECFLRIVGAISLIIADHVEACKLTRHLGNAALKNGRECWTSIQSRIDTQLDFTSFNMTRRRAQTDIVVRQTTIRYLANPNKSNLKNLQKSTGIRMGKCPFEGLEVDPHLQTVTDLDHMFDLGIVKTLLDHIVTKLTTSEKELCATRLRYFPSPPGWNSIKMPFEKVAKKFQPISFMRKYLIVAQYVYKGLITNALFDLLNKTIELRGYLYASSHNSDSILKVWSLFQYSNTNKYTMNE